MMGTAILIGVGFAVATWLVCVLVVWRTGLFYDRHTRRQMEIREANVSQRETALADGWDQFRLWADSEREALREQRAKFRAERIELGAKAHDLKTQIQLWKMENDTTRIQRTR